MNDMETHNEIILQTLEPLFERADKEGLWFYTSYQGLWFSPEQLRKQNDNGKFIWGANNWQLRDPQERLNQLESEAIAAKNKYEFFKKELLK